MKHVWSVLCRNYIVDEKTKNFSLIDLPNRLGFKGELPEKRPFDVPIPSEFYFLTRWISEEGDKENIHAVMVRVIDPTGGEIGNFEFEFTLKPPMGHVSIGTMSSVLYSEDGLYFFKVSLQDNNESIVVASIPLEIVHEQQESEEQDKSEPAQ